MATGLSPDRNDAEWADRVRAHRDRRPPNWQTVETLDIAQVLQCADAPVLIDCLGTWLARILDEERGWDGDSDSLTRVGIRTDEFLAAWQTVTVPAVAVSNEVGSGVVPATAPGRIFRDALGSLNNRVADASDQVIFVVAGRALRPERTR